MEPGATGVRGALAVLGLEPGADRDAVTEAYRRLAKSHHPDVSRAADAAERFAAIASAYQEALAATPVRVDEEPAPWSSPVWYPQAGRLRGSVIVAGPVHVEPPARKDGGLRWT